jgi:hypothetical protein
VQLYLIEKLTKRKNHSSSHRQLKKKEKNSNTENTFLLFEKFFHGFYDMRSTQPILIKQFFRLP